MSTSRSTSTPQSATSSDSGSGAIRNVGENAVKDIIAERETGRGKYVNFMDFIRRVPLTR